MEFGDRLKTGPAAAGVDISAAEDVVDGVVDDDGAAVELDCCAGGGVMAGWLSPGRFRSVIGWSSTWEAAVLLSDWTAETEEATDNSVVAPGDDGPRPTCCTTGAPPSPVIASPAEPDPPAAAPPCPIGALLPLTSTASGAEVTTEDTTVVGG
jgi:hypothetical protein